MFPDKRIHPCPDLVRQLGVVLERLHPGQLRLLGGFHLLVNLLDEGVGVRHLEDFIDDRQLGGFVRPGGDRAQAQGDGEEPEAAAGKKPGKRAFHAGQSTRFPARRQAHRHLAPPG